jgi:hypothetical protein
MAANGRQRGVVPLGDDPFVSIRLHGFRHASNDLARRAAVALKAGNPGTYDHYSPEDFGRALLGHQLIRSVHDAYRDLNAERLTVSVGPEYGTVDADHVREAAKEASRGAGADLLLVCAFAFDATAGETTKEFAPHDGAGWAVAAEERKLGRLRVLLVRMNPDLAIGADLLKKTGAGNLFMVFGEPDVEIRRVDADHLQVEIRGVDVYDPTTGQVRSSTTDDIACWFVDTNYNEESFFVREAYFTGTGDPYGSLRKALRADIDEQAWASLYRTESRPFPEPETGKIAIKVINHYGDEVMKVYDLAAEIRAGEPEAIVQVAGKQPT